MASEIVSFFSSVLATLWSLLPIFLIALLLTGLFLAALFSGVKERVRRRVTFFDDELRATARRMRYHSPHDEATDRVKWTWFFRFWTNFASAPSLSFWSLFIPFLMWHRALSLQLDARVASSAITLWLLPGVCYAGSMLLSFGLKRVFRRVRPPREGQAFGYKLKDPSFPSGHSLTSFCFWLMLSVVVASTGALPTAGVVAFCLLAMAIPLLTGWSRVYLGVHFPSDVLGGYCIGLTWCIVSYFVFLPLLTR